jgi:hypothetical protein
MPLPVIFKFLSDTSGLKFNEVDRGLGDMRVSSQKAGMAVKSLASIIRSGQEPVEALANSVSSLTRAFGLGVGATVAVVGVVEVIKSFISESQKLNKVSEQLNTTLTNIRNTSEQLTFSSAISQVKALAVALEDARKQAEGEKGGILGRVGRSIADVMGLSEYRLGFTQDAVRNQEALARDSARTALQKEIELATLKKTAPFEVKRLEIQDKYFQIERNLQRLGFSQQDQMLARTRMMQELVDLREEEFKEQRKTQELEAKAFSETLQQKEEELRKTIAVELEKRKQIEETRKQQQKYFEEGLRGAGTILDRVKEAAERAGRKDIVREIEARRKEEQKRSDELLLGALGRPEGTRDFRSTREIETARIGQFAGIEAEVQRQETMGLFNQVDAVRAEVFKIVEILNSRLGVPILRTAY